MMTHICAYYVRMAMIVLTSMAKGNNQYYLNHGCIIFSNIFLQKSYLLINTIH